MLFWHKKEGLNMYDLNKQKEAATQFVPGRKMLVVQSAVLFLFFFPLFFQLSGSIFDNPEMKFDSQGQLTQLPIPIAAIVCFAGIALLLRLDTSQLGMGFIFAIFIAMFFAVIISTEGFSQDELAKFILLIQFILPMFALILGALYIRPKSEYLRFEAIALYVLLIIVPGEVIATITSGSALLTPYLYAFSLYQHLQYLPVIFVGFYFLSVASLFKARILRCMVIFLAPFIGVYVSASLSALTILLVAIVSLAAIWLLILQRNKRFGFSVIVLLWVGFAAHYPIMQSNPTYNLKYGDERVENMLKKVKRLKIIDSEQQESSLRHTFLYLLPGNIIERFYYWEFYGKGVLESPKKFFFGHSKRPDRNSYPSAHNYYLDLIYNFGIISLLPFLYLIFQTIKKCKAGMSHHLGCSNFAMLVLLVSFYVLIDNSLKVSFRQPYPGMMIFFLWGVLLAKPSKFEAKNRPGTSQ